MSRGCRLFGAPTDSVCILAGVLSIDTNKPARTRRAQTDLVRAVLDAPTSEQETNWLEWKGTLGLTSKAAEATIAKAVLGFANRSPDVAARTLEGCACLLVGVEPSALSGVAPIDQAKLEAGVNVYAGTGVDWSSDYVEVDGKTVLVVTVEPPRWGDPIHPFRKGYLPDGKSADRMPAGAVFIRRSASTERATAADIDMLSARSARQPGAHLAVDVRPAAASEIIRIDVSPESIDAFVAGEEESLLRRLKPQTNLMETILLSRGNRDHVEYRSEDEYRQEISDYGAALRKELPQLLAARSVLHDLGLLELEVVNSTDSTFTSVQVELCFPARVGVCVWRRDAVNRNRPPDRPVPYGEVPDARAAGGIADALLGGETTKRPVWVPEVERQDDGGKVVVFQPRDVRARGKAKLDKIWLMLNHRAPRELNLRWEATAHHALRRIGGSLVVPVAERLATPDELRASPTVVRPV